MPKTQVHTVKKGENLDKIAKSYGLKSFKDIFNDPVNAKFRKQRPKPDLIQPGDKIIIPKQSLPKETRNSIAGLVKHAEARVKRLEDDLKFYANLGKDIDKSFSNAKSGFKKTSNAVDAAAFVATFMVSIGKIVKIGAKQGSMTVKELAKSNKDVIKIVEGTRKDVAQMVGGKVADDMTKSANSAVANAATIANFCLSVTSPSFLGKVFVKAQNENLFQKIADGKLGKSSESLVKILKWDPAKEFDKEAALQQKRLQASIDSTKAAIASDQALIKELKAIEKL